MIKLTYGKKSKKGLLSVTLLAVATIALTVVVAAVTVGSFQGGEVTVGGMASSSVMYSLDNLAGPYTATLEPSGVSTPWFTRLEIGASSYNGPTTITWQLEQKTGPSTWTTVSGATTTTTVTLSGNAENIYASSDGTTTGNYDWSADVTAAGTYRVVVTVESA